ncbi:MAG: hypothetical protein JO149_05375 [Gammaproteobacteria bacterium]|nr:hypothetical protein [Gammaproteobacteria bacterium]
MPTLLNVANRLMTHPERIKLLAKYLTALSFIQFRDSGDSDDNYAAWTKKLISLLPVVQKTNHRLVNHLEECFKNRKDTLEDFSLNDEWRFLRIQGRTILLQNNEGEILAVKVKKTHEPVEELHKEYQTTQFLKERADDLKLKSYFPDALGVYKIDDIKKILAQAGFSQDLIPTDFITSIGSITNQVAYIYKVASDHTDYFTYLHDSVLSHETFCAANRVTINDLLRLLANGIVYHQLADIFHNANINERRLDRGRYFVLTNLLTRLGTRYGTGRLDKWKKAVEFPNVRGEGGADWGDWICLDDFLRQPFFVEAQQLHKENISNFVLPNIVAEYLYILFLIAGKRGCDLTQQVKQSGKTEQEIEEDIKIIWLELAKQMFDNCALAMTYFTSFTELQARTFLATVVNEDLIAKQMRFWMTQDYIKPFKEDKIPPGIYDDSVTLYCEFDQVRKNTFNEEIGCSMNGVDPDLGTVNGQEPIKEFNKALYWTISGTVCWYHVFSQANREIDTLAMQSDSELIKEELPKKQIASLSKEQLKTLITYRESLAHKAKISLPGEQAALQQLREQYAAKILQESCRKKIQALKLEKSFKDEAAKSLSPLFVGARK